MCVDPYPEGEALLRAEERVHPGLRPICDSIRRLDAFRENRLSRSELLDEIDERAEALYGKLWMSCSDTEKLELRHIAQFGFANPGHSRAVRQLIMKRLLRKDPDLRLMNRTFRRFVVSPQTTGHVAQRDVARIESGLEASGWDQIRGPFVIGVLGLAAFLYFTQRETYNVTVGAMVGLATQVPNLLKAIYLGGTERRRTARRPAQRVRTEGAKRRAPRWPIFRYKRSHERVLSSRAGVRTHAALGRDLRTRPRGRSFRRTWMGREGRRGLSRWTGRVVDDVAECGA